VEAGPPPCRSCGSGSSAGACATCVPRTSQRCRTPSIAGGRQPSELQARAQFGRTTNFSRGTSRTRSTQRVRGAACRSTSTNEQAQRGAWHRETERSVHLCPQPRPRSSAWFGSAARALRERQCALGRRALWHLRLCIALDRERTTPSSTSSLPPAPRPALSVQPGPARGPCLLGQRALARVWQVAARRHISPSPGRAVSTVPTSCRRPRAASGGGTRRPRTAGTPARTVSAESTLAVSAPRLSHPRSEQVAHVARLQRCHMSQERACASACAAHPFPDGGERALAGLVRARSGNEHAAQGARTLRCAGGTARVAGGLDGGVCEHGDAPSAVLGSEAEMLCRASHSRDAVHRCRLR
jgi:hypothetical protein